MEGARTENEVSVRNLQEVRRERHAVINLNGRMYQLLHFNGVHVNFVCVFLQMQYGYMRAFPRRRSDSSEVTCRITVQYNCVVYMAFDT